MGEMHRGEIMKCPHCEEEIEIDIKDPLFGLAATQKRAEQLSVNFNWLLAKIDEMHIILCSDTSHRLLTWQQRVEQLLIEVKGNIYKM